MAIDPGLFDLFREEARAHTEALSRGLLELESEPANSQRIEPLMRAAHSLKGAARIASIDAAVDLAHAMEDALVAAQDGKITITSSDIDSLLRGTDILAGLGKLADAGAIPAWQEANQPAVASLVPLFNAMLAGQPVTVTPRREEREPEAIVVTDVGNSALPEPPVCDMVVISDEPFLLEIGHSQFDLFREETRAHLRVISTANNKSAIPDEVLESLRQLRGAALLMKCPPIAEALLAVANLLQAVREKRLPTEPAITGWVNHLIAVLAPITQIDEEEFPAALAVAEPALVTMAQTLAKRPQRPVPATPPPAAPTVKEPAPTAPASPPPPPAEAVVRVTAQSLNRLMGLAGESLVQARWLNHFSDELMKVKKQHDLLNALLDDAFPFTAETQTAEPLTQSFVEIRRQAGVCRKQLANQASDFDEHAARAEDLNTRLYREVIASRMRPFGDAIHGLPRVVRDMARTLGKQARLVIEGEQTDVDRDILEKLEAPLSHLIRNAVDHGLDTVDERRAAGKAEAGTVRVHAWHRAGMLSVTVADDGRGIDLERLRKKIVERGLNSADLVTRMTEAELLEFLFLPGFTTTAAVTEFSGRGVGLDVVQDTVRRVGGSVRITTKTREGTTFHLQLPITLSVIRAVVVEIGGEPYAFPHTRIDRLLNLTPADIRSLEHRQFITVDGSHVGLVLASQLLELPANPSRTREVPVVLLSDSNGTYGLIIDAIRGEQDLVVRPLDARLGKVPNVSAAAILDDGGPVLILDVEDLIRSMDQFIQTGTLRRLETRAEGPARNKRVLVVDDSITVREVERQLLIHKGYEVAVAVDGMDGWNQIRSGRFDLVVTDVDMPRMTGLQLVQSIRSEERLRELPVIIVSYKEREEDRIRGLEVGANAYLTKSSFHDNRFAETVADLIGEA